MSGKQSGSAVALSDVINQGLKTRTAPPPAVPPPSAAPPAAPPAAESVVVERVVSSDQTPAPVYRAAPEPGEWAGPVPKVSVDRRPLNVGLPTVLQLHERLAQYAFDTGVTVQDVVAAATDEWLTAQGPQYARGWKRTRRR